mmetsp:Transcript_26526/g.79699  ORF Transcript_26526/g.79699 Transcript_26526/m.79699 type:complete len:210 (+) Transcript_26526:189-818(+)
MVPALPRRDRHARAPGARRRRADGRVPQGHRGRTGQAALCVGGAHCVAWGVGDRRREPRGSAGAARSAAGRGGVVAVRPRVCHLLPPDDERAGAPDGAPVHPTHAAHPAPAVPGGRAGRRADVFGGVRQDAAISAEHKGAARLGRAAGAAHHAHGRRGQHRGERAGVQALRRGHVPAVHGDASQGKEHARRAAARGGRALLGRPRVLHF